MYGTIFDETPASGSQTVKQLVVGVRSDEVSQDPAMQADKLGMFFLVMLGRRTMLPG